MAMFTEEHKDTAKMFEVICGSTLAKYFISEVSERKVEDINTAEDAANALRGLTEFMERDGKNLKMLNDIRDGKYRLLFMALAAGMEQVGDDIRANMTDEEIDKWSAKMKEDRDNGKDK